MDGQFSSPVQQSLFLSLFFFDLQAPSPSQFSSYSRTTQFIDIQHTDMSSNKHTLSQNRHKVHAFDLVIRFVINLFPFPFRVDLSVRNISRKEERNTSREEEERRRRETFPILCHLALGKAQGARCNFTTCTTPVALCHVSSDSHHEM